MEIDCHNCCVDRYIIVKTGNVLLYVGWLKCSPFLSGRVMTDFIIISGLILCLACYM